MFVLKLFKKVKRLSLLAYWLLCITQTGVEMVCILTIPTIFGRRVLFEELCAQQIV